MQAKWVVPVWCVIAVCLAGCGHKSTGSTATASPTVNGGGGGGGGIAVPFVTANTTSPALGGASAPGAFTGAGFVADFATPNPADSANGAMVTVTTDASGNLSQIIVCAPTGGGGVCPSASSNTNPFSKKFGPGNPLTAPITLNQLVSIVQQVQAAPTNTVTYIYQGTETGLSASSFGAWLQNNGSGNFAFGPVAFGIETTAGQMTALAGTGVATYNGSTFGLGATGGTPFAFTGAATITANFTSGAVSSSFTGLTTSNLSGVGVAIALPNIAGAGTIGLGVNTNQYAFALAGGAFTGNVTGTFYGATAQETAGVWQATNGTGTSLAATFGAHK
jgi:hypothetical protein